MILSDREWLRFVTFAFVAGAIAGTLATGALLLSAVPPVVAIVGALTGSGIAAVAIHVTMRVLLDRASEPPAEDPEPEGETA